jgi:hypothetical protein
LTMSDRSPSGSRQVDRRRSSGNSGRAPPTPISTRPRAGSSSRSPTTPPHGPCARSAPFRGRSPWPRGPLTPITTTFPPRTASSRRAARTESRLVSPSIAQRLLRTHPGSAGAPPADPGAFGHGRPSTCRVSSFCHVGCCGDRGCGGGSVGAGCGSVGLGWGQGGWRRSRSMVRCGSLRVPDALTAIGRWPWGGLPPSDGMPPRPVIWDLGSGWPASVR